MFLSNKLQIALILISILFIQRVNAQLFRPLCYPMDYVEKTMEIKQLFDTTQAFKKINLYTFSSFRLYTNEQAESNLLDSSFYAKSIQNPQNYLDKYTPDTMSSKRSIRHLYQVKQDDAAFNQFCSEFAKGKLNKYAHLWPYRIYPVKEDSAIIVNELAKMKQIFKTSILDNYKISNELAKVLGKKSCDIAVVIDNTLYMNYFVLPQVGNTITLYRIYVVDVHNRELIYYNAISSECNELFNAFDYLSSGQDFVGTYKELLHHTKYYFKANKKYWKKKGVKLNKYYVPEK